MILDEKPFTLNGYGEYFNFKGKGVYFTLQRRMEPLLADHGSPSKATLYTVFAAKEMNQTLYRSGKYREYRNIDYFMYVVMGHMGIQL